MRRARGVTLIELLLVIGLIAAATALAASVVTAGLPGQQLRSAAREVAAQLRYTRAQAIVTEQAPWIFLWLPQDLYGVAKRVQSWRPQADSRINLHRVRVA